MKGRLRLARDGMVVILSGMTPDCPIKKAHCTLPRDTRDERTLTHHNRVPRRRKGYAARMPQGSIKGF